MNLEHPEFIREMFADEFLGLNRDWFTSKQNEFCGLLERAEGILQVWTVTGKFPDTNGIWIVFENKFNEFIEVMRRNGHYKL